MKLREKLEQLMLAITFAEANCNKEAKLFLKELKNKNQHRSKQKVVSRPVSRIRC